MLHAGRKAGLVLRYDRAKEERETELVSTKGAMASPRVDVIATSVSWAVAILNGRLRFRFGQEDHAPVAKSLGRAVNRMGG